MQFDDHNTAEDCEECVIPAPAQTRVDNPDGSSTLHCVKCPFCLQIVSAHMTRTQISCPECKAVATYT